MHVAIDAVGSVGGGGWAVLSRLLTEIRDDPRIRRITVFGSPRQLFGGSLPAGPIDWVSREREHRSLAARIFWYERGLDRACRTLKPDVAVCMNGMGRTGIPRIQIVQQAFALHPGFIAPAPASFAVRQATIRRLTLSACRTARRVVVQTSWMQRGAQRELGHQHDVRVLPLGLPRPLDRASKLPRVVCVSTNLPYKRRETAEATFALVRETFSDHRFDIVSGEHSPDEVMELLRKAQVLVAPSDIESLGLPVVEAFAARCAVVAADRPWARSIASDGAVYFAPGDAGAAAELVESLLGDDALRSRVVGAGVARLEELWHPEPYDQFVDLCEEVA